MSLATFARQKASPPVYLLVLALILALATSVRCGNLRLLRETYVLDNDSFRFLRIAEADAAGRPISARDSMRWLPAGRDMTTHLSLHSLIISRLYKAAVHLGYKGQVRSLAIRYPVACYLACIVILYLLLARYLSSIAGLVAALGLAVEPATIYRSSTGFVDRDPTCLLLILCAYAAYAGMLCEGRPNRSLAAAVLCAVFSASLGLTWEGVGLFTVPFAITLAWMAMTGLLSGRLLALHFAWCAIAIPPLLVFTHADWEVQEPYAALALLPVPFVCACALALSGSRGLGRRCRALSGLSTWSPLTMFPALSAGLFLGILGVTIRVHPRFAAAIPALLGNAISTCGRSPLERAIGELRNLFLIDWWIDAGPLIALRLARIMHHVPKIGTKCVRRKGVKRAPFVVLNGS